MEWKKSQFLKQELERDQKEEEGVRETGFNPRDLRGRKLSDFWRNGDTIMSVAIKKFKFLSYTLLNPDTYTFQELETSKDYFMLNKRIFVPYFLLFTFPFFIIIPRAILRFQAVKRNYYMNKLLKKKFIENSLGIKSRERMKLSKLKKIIDKNELEK